MQAETDVAEVSRSDREKCKISFHGVRALVTNPVPACDKIDNMFGSGGEVIIHYMWFEQGHKFFDQMLQNSPHKTKGEMLKELIDVQPRAGWGKVSITIVRNNPPAVEIVVKNPPIKSVKGSQKRLIGSFWAGVFTRYFDRQLTCKNFSYNAEKDEFSCLVTIDRV